MTILDDVLGSLFTTSGRADRKLERLIAEGEHTTARVEGLRIVTKSDSGDEWMWRLSVRGGTGEFVTGVRQQLIPHAEYATLGTVLDVIHRDGHVAIDWPSTLERLSGAADPAATITTVKTRIDPPEPGIVDERLDRKRLERGERTTGTLLSSEPVVVMGMPTQNRHLRLRLAGGREVDLKRALVPEYARHLAQVGAELPVAVDPKKPDKVSVDWPAAAAAAAPR